eukprot:gene8661-21534_t
MIADPFSRVPLGARPPDMGPVGELVPVLSPPCDPLGRLPPSDYTLAGTEAKVVAAPISSVRELLHAAARDAGGQLHWHRPRALVRFLDAHPPTGPWGAPVSRAWFAALPSKGAEANDEVHTGLEFLLEETGLEAGDVDRMYPAVLRALLGIDTEPATDDATLGGIAEVRPTAVIALVTRALADEQFATELAQVAARIRAAPDTYLRIARVLCLIAPGEHPQCS